MERPVSRVNRGNGLISVGAEVSLWGQPFRGLWSGADLRPVSGICLDLHALMLGLRRFRGLVW